MKKLLILILVVLSAPVFSQPLGINTNKLNDICYQSCKGYIHVNPVGGTTPYTYLWDDGATVQNKDFICAGTYTVTVTDAVSTTKSKTVTITQPAAPVSYSITTGVDYATVTGVTGGTPPYTYTWTTTPAQTTATATGLTSGTYFVSVADSRNCRQVQAAIIP